MSPRSSRRAGVLAIVAAATALELLVLGGCTDGATPDCSDAAAGCSPDLDGAIDEADVGEASPAHDATPGDAPADCPATPDAVVADAPGDAPTSPDADGGLKLLDAKDG